MTDDQTNRHDMHRAVLGVLDTHADAWAPVPAMQDHRDALAGFVETVRQAAQAQAQTSKPATAVKKALRAKVEDRSWRLANAIAAWARANARPDVAAAVTRTRRAFDAFRDAALAEYSEIVVAEAREHLPAPEEPATSKLGRYGVTAAFVDELDALDDDYAEALSTPRQAIAATKGAGRAIAVAIKPAQTYLGQEVDPTVAFLAPDMPAFAEAYRNARVIVDRGHGPGPGDTDAPPD
ncbi:hypothetical protein [Rubrivirga sp. IMCC45206]|uniref:hypothetical protein n=1 Tax=Rubrivirga sp. IMCC45206 TaxID=3391614 RepID=UPI00398FCDFA